MENKISTILDIKDLYVQYNTDEGVVHALNGLNLELKKGETKGLVGETGAGKTTMAMSILSLLPEKVGQVTDGQIMFNGSDILKNTARDMQSIRGKKIAMIFQDPMSSLNPVIRVGEQIAEVLKLHNKDMSKKEISDRVDRIMSLIGISPDRKNEYPYQFSGGMKQRIVIAIALVCEPELLLADEPTTALDVTIQAQILELMKQLRDEFKTSMVFITHDLGVVANFCDTVSVIYGGEVVESGTVEQVYARKSNHPYTKGLFDCIPYINTTSARLTPIEGFVLDPRNLPQGCKFCDRCPNAMDKCKKYAPPSVSLDGHEIKCFLFEGRTGEDNG